MRLSDFSPAGRHWPAAASGAPARTHLSSVHVSDDVATVVADRLNKVPGVTATETHIAFRTYSRHDLESAFSLGLD